MKGDLNRLKEAKASKSPKMRSRIGKGLKTPPTPDTVNRDGFPAFSQDARKEFIRTVMCNIVKNQYYMDKDISQSEAIKILSNFKNHEFALKTAVYARKHGMKLMPKMVIAALSKDADFCSKHEDAIVKLLSTFHPSQLHEYLEIQKSGVFGKGLGKVQQRWIREAVNLWPKDKQEDYTMKFSDDFRLIQLLTHPKKYLPLTGYLFHKDEPVTKRQKALQKLKTEKNETKFLEIMVDNEIPFEAVKAFIPQTAKAYFAMMMNTGVQGALLNTVSYLKHGVFSLKGALERYEMALSPENIRKSRILPIEIIKPILMLRENGGNRSVERILIQAYVAAFDNVIKMGHSKVAVSIDQSGSMQGTPLVLAASFAAMFIGNTENTWVTGFNTSLWEEGTGLLPKLTGIGREEMFARLFGLRADGGTNTALFIQHALITRKEIDLFVILTDEQQNAGNALYQAFKTYQRSMNPEAKMLIINSASLPWSSSPSADESVLVYPTMTPTVFDGLRALKNLDSMYSEIEEIEI